jgi:hypothetical protein
MLNRFAKFLMAATSLSPILGAVAVNQFALHRPWTSWTDLSLLADHPQSEFLARLRVI